MSYLFRNALAPNTHAAYNSGTTAFINFCLHYHRFSQQGSIIPATEDTLLLFVSYLSVKVCPSTIKVYLSAVRNLHIQHGFPSPVEHSILLPRLLRGVKRTYGIDQRPRLPITPSLLTSFRQHRQYPMAGSSHCLGCHASGILRLSPLIRATGSKTQ